MAKSESADETAKRIAGERAGVTCRFCGGKAVHFPPVGRPQTDAVCSDCAERAPWVSIVDSVAELAHPEPPEAVEPRPVVRPRPARDFTKENFT